MTKLPLAPIKRIAVEGGAQRIGIPAAKVLGLAAEEWIKRVTVAAEKYAVHAGRKTTKPEDIVIVVRDMGINVPIPQKEKSSKSKKSNSAAKPAPTPSSPPPATAPQTAAAHTPKPLHQQPLNTGGSSAGTAQSAKAQSDAMKKVQ
jgi:DNA-binding protein